MSWNKEGKQITATYQGQQVTGTVESSRVKYGAGKVEHLLILDQPRSEEHTSELQSQR